VRPPRSKLESAVVCLVVVLRQGASRVGLVPSPLCYTNRPPAIFRSCVNFVTACHWVSSSDARHLVRIGFPELAVCLHQGLIFPCLCSFDFCSNGVWIILGTRLDLTLELPDQRARGFLVPFALKRLFPQHIHMLFGEMSMRT
jgi:hypothetical protein